MQPAEETAEGAEQAAESEVTRNTRESPPEEGEGAEAMAESRG